MIFHQRALALTALLLCLPGSLLATRNEDFKPATPQELAMKSVANAPGAHAVILHWSDYQDDASFSHSEYFRIKVLDEEGKKEADVEIPYVRNFTTVRDIKARTIRPDGSIVPFDGKIFDKLIVKSRSVKVMAKTFTLPDVQAGSILEYRYVSTWPPMLYPTRWVLQRDLPIVKATFILKPYSGSGFATYFLHVGVEKLPTWAKDHYELEVDNIAPFPREEFSPPEQELKPRIEFFYHLGSLGSEDKFWAATAKEGSEEAERFIGKRDGIKKAAETLVAPGDDALTKARKIYARVQKIENLSFAEEMTEQEEKRVKHHDNRHVQDVWENGYGYHAELNRLYVALVRAVGLEATPVWLSSRDEVFFTKGLLDVHQLNREVVELMVGGNTIYVDPGNPMLPFGLLPWASSGVTGLRLVKGDAASWIQTPDEKKENAVTSRRARLSLEDGIVKGTVHVEFGGQEAFIRRADWLHDDEGARKKAVEDEVKAWLPEGAQVKLTKLAGSGAIDDAVVADFDVELPGLESNAGSRTLLRLSVFQARSRNSFAAQERRQPIYFNYNHTIQDDVELVIPAGYKVESVPQDVSIDLKAFLFDNRWKREPNSIHLTRRFDTSTLLVSKDHYATVREFFSKMQNADEGTVVLRRQ